MKQLLGLANKNEGRSDSHALKPLAAPITTELYAP